MTKTDRLVFWVKDREKEIADYKEIRDQALEAGNEGRGTYYAKKVRALEEQVEKQKERYYQR